MKISALIGATVSAALLLSGCATSPKDFYANPAKADATALCRAWFDAKDPQFKADVGSELLRRGFTVEQCQNRITSQNVGVGIVALTALTTAAVISCQNGGCAGGGGGYGYGYAWDNIPDGYGGRIWRCRDRGNGEFADDYHCPAIQSDYWPYN
jgi:hypothetical protein